MINNFGRYLKNLMKQKKLTTKELGSKVGVSDATISFIENNKRSPSIKVLSKIADVLEVTVADIFLNSTDSESGGVHRYSSVPLADLDDLDWFNPDFNYKYYKSTNGFYPRKKLDDFSFSIKGRLLFALKIVDDTMYPEFIKNDIIIVDPAVYSNTEKGLSSGIKGGDFVIASIRKQRISYAFADSKKEDRLFRQIVFDNDTSYLHLRALNPDYGDLKCKIKQTSYDDNIDIIQIIGKVIRKIRQY